MVTKALDICTEGLYSSYTYEYPMESQQTLFRYSPDLDLASQKVAGIPLNQGAKKIYKCPTCNNTFYDYICDKRKFCSRKCVVYSEETKRKIGIKSKGRIHSIESRQKMSLYHKTHPNKGWFKKGHKNSEEIRNKISDLLRKQHYLKGKTYEEFHGIEKAKEIKKKIDRTKYAHILTRNFLREEHILNKKPLRIISNELGISIWTVYGYMKRYNIPRLRLPKHKKVVISSIKRQTRSESMKKRWRNPEYREKMLRVMKEKLHIDSVYKKSRQGFKKYCRKYGHPLKGKKWDENRVHPRGMLGKVSPMRGKHPSLNTRQKMRETRLKLWRNPEYREKTIKATIKSLLKSPTSYERKIISLIKKYNLPFKYTGDGQIIIDSLNPDFMSTNGKKLIIETYTQWCHIDNYEEVRSKRLFKYGYKILFLSDEILYRNPNWEQICLTKINDFII